VAQLQAKCFACGTLVKVDVAQPFTGAEVVTPFCSDCTDQQFIDHGGAVLTLRRQLAGARFSLGDKITITAGAVEALGEASQHAVEFLVHHASGEWGAFGHCDRIELNADEQNRGWEATDDSAKINKSNLLNVRDRIMSEYQTNRGIRLWVITCLDGAGETTVLRPEEY
jgi:hypothetical protein